LEGSGSGLRHRKSAKSGRTLQEKLTEKTMDLTASGKPTPQKRLPSQPSPVKFHGGKKKQLRRLKLLVTGTGNPILFSLPGEKKGKNGRTETSNHTSRSIKVKIGSRYVHTTMTVPHQEQKTEKTKSNEKEQSLLQEVSWRGGKKIKRAGQV